MNMHFSEDIHNPEIKNQAKQLKEQYGYEIQRVEPLEEISALLYEFLHTPTGARFIHISIADTENMFGVAFKTVPKDSTGVAHILEHTALCSTENYPVRDPFFSMMKRSLNTFMNAFTASDWTLYPFATENQKDYYNLMDVYLDAAFFPRLDRLNFLQEGHRLEFEETPEGKKQPEFKGVVYNEMKGAMSSPNQILFRNLQAAIFPENTYRFNSGGEPEDIPSLTHEDLVAFHKRHYHPSNSFFFTYGTFPVYERLVKIHDKVLSRFSPIDPKTEVNNQSRWERPAECTVYYPIAKGEKTEKKSQVCLAWMTVDIRDSFRVMVMKLLENILLGNSASPLRKALIDSGLGSALSDGTGYDADFLDTLFLCGLKDTDISCAKEIETLILDTLANICETGIDKELVDSAIHQMEFHRKEIKNHPLPYGLRLFLLVSGAWFHGGDPLRILSLNNDLGRLHKEMEKGGFFENMIRTHLLDNPHRVRFHLVPDPDLEEKKQKAEKEKLEKIASQLTKQDMEQIEKDTKALEELQNAPEDLSVLPTLALTDIPPDVRSIKPHSIVQSSFMGDAQLNLYEEPTGEIVYFAFAAGAGTVSKEDMPYLPFFCRALTRTATEKMDYTELARRIDLYTGGLGAGVSVRTTYGDEHTCLPLVSLNGKCLARNQAKTLELIFEIIKEFRFDDLTRLKNLLMEYRAQLESSVVQNGHVLAMSLAARNISRARAMGEILNGVSQLQFIKGITDNMGDQKLNQVAEKLYHMGKGLFTSTNLKVAMVCENAHLTAGSDKLETLMEEMPISHDTGFKPPVLTTEEGTPWDGWHTSTAVSFVARALSAVPLGHPDAPALAVVAKLLRTLYIHKEIREKGGAYGGFSRYNPEDGVFFFGSYRDPHVVRTLNTYESAMGYIQKADLSKEDIKEAVLQVCSEIDKPDPPGPAAVKAFYRTLVGLTDEMRKGFKKALVEMDENMVKNAAAKYMGKDAPRAVAVITSEQKLAETNKKLGDNPLHSFKI